MRRLIPAALLTTLCAMPVLGLSTVRTCPSCPCPPPPGCVCPSPPPPPCLGLGPLAGFDTNADIEPGDAILNVVVNANVVAGANVSIYLLPPVNNQSLFPPDSPPMTYNQEMRTFVSSYSCYPNNLMPAGACPINLNPQSAVSPQQVTAFWSPGEPLPGPGSYMVFRLALDQPPELPDLTLQPTQFLVATVSGHIQFQNSGMVPINYSVYRQLSTACPCLADMNGDGQRNGRDIRAFVNCLFAGGGVGCNCADLDFNGAPGRGDIAPFVSTLLSGVPCP